MVIEEPVEFRHGRAKNCSRCAAPFECGIGRETCWCNQMASLERAQLDSSSDCLCPKCLQQVTDLAATPENAGEDR